MWLCGAKRRAKGILWLQLSGCPELTEVREEAYGCIRGYTELAGVQEGAYGCLRGYTELTGS